MLWVHILPLMPGLQRNPSPLPFLRLPHLRRPLLQDPMRSFVQHPLQFDTVNNSYTISTINPKIQRLVICPAGFVPGACITTDLPTHVIQLNSTLPFNVTSANTVLLLNYTERVLLSPLNCSALSICHSYINNSAKAKPWHSTNICSAFRTGGSTAAYSVRVLGNVENSQTSAKSND